MDDTWTPWLSLCAAILALLAPIFTAAINNLHNNKIKILEIKYNQFLAVFNEFTDSYYKLSLNDNESTTAEFERAAVNLAVICYEKEAQENILKLSKLVVSKKGTAPDDETNELYYKCIRLVMHEIPQKGIFDEIKALVKHKEKNKEQG